MPDTSSSLAAPTPEQIEQTERALIAAAQEIGGIAESNCHATYVLASQIRRDGRAVTALTVGELLNLVQQHRAYWKA